jgi:exodeoxyribonuclease VII small subunit
MPFGETGSSFLRIKLLNVTYIGLPHSNGSTFKQKIDEKPTRVYKNMPKKTFEDSLARLEEISRELEDGELNLETSLKRFEEGIKLVQFCSKKLDESQKKIDLLLEKDGVLTTKSFDPEDLYSEND